MFFSHELPGLHLSLFTVLVLKEEVHSIFKPGMYPSPPPHHLFNMASFPLFSFQVRSLP